MWWVGGFVCRLGGEKWRSVHLQRNTHSTTRARGDAAERGNGQYLGKGFSFAAISLSHIAHTHPEDTSTHNNGQAGNWNTNLVVSGRPVLPLEPLRVCGERNSRSRKGHQSLVVKQLWGNLSVTVYPNQIHVTEFAYNHTIGFFWTCSTDLLLQDISTHNDFFPVQPECT